MIEEIALNKQKYFWYRSDDLTIIAGGSHGGRFFGQIEFILKDEVAIAEITVSNGVSSSIRLSPREYSSQTSEYEMISHIYENIDDYLQDKEIINNQEANREILLQNLFELLPRYENIE